MAPCQQLHLRAQTRAFLRHQQHLRGKNRLAAVSDEDERKRRTSRSSRGIFCRRRFGKGLGGNQAGTRGGLHVSVRAEPPEIEGNGEESTPSTSSAFSGTQQEGEEDLVSLVPQQSSTTGPKSIEAYEREFAQADLAEFSATANEDKTAVQKFLFPEKDELPDDVEMSIWEHLEELRERILVSVIGVGVMITGCFCYSKQLVEVLESPVADKGVKFLQLSPGEFFFTSFKVWLYEI